jgi:hypothetical protein
MKILVPNDIFLPEREYVIRVIFENFLGLNFTIETHVEKQVRIEILNGKVLILEDHFFSGLASTEHLFNSVNIPTSIRRISIKKNQFLSEPDLPILYGDDQFIASEKCIIVGNDIIAGTFFLLTRWEEYLRSKKDQHSRFPASEAFTVKFGVHCRPIVDEYVEFLWKILTHLGINQKRKERQFKAIITHDVDFPLQWTSPFSLMKKLGGDLLKRKSVKQANASLLNFLQVKKGTARDPFDTFDYMMDQSEKYGLQSHFFFLCGGNSKYDKGHLPPSHPFVRQLMDKINKRGHIIGFHPSYNTYHDSDLFKKELEFLQKYSPQEIKCGRQHFLCFENPTTWRIWEENGMEWDSTMYFPEVVGFRCGTCHSFPVFNILERRTLKLREVPMTVMDMTFPVYQKKSKEEALADIHYLLEITKKYKGNFVLLWHNTFINSPEWKNMELIEESLMKAL